MYVHIKVVKIYVKKELNDTTTNEEDYIKPKSVSFHTWDPTSQKWFHMKFEQPIANL